MQRTSAILSDKCCTLCKDGVFIINLFSNREIGIHVQMNTTQCYTESVLHDVILNSVKYVTFSLLTWISVNPHKAVERMKEHINEALERCSKVSTCIVNSISCLHWRKTTRNRVHTKHKLLGERKFSLTSVFRLLRLSVFLSTSCDYR